MSRLLINPVSRSLNGTVINCEDVGTSEVSSTTVVIRESDSLQGSHELLLTVRPRVHDAIHIFLKSYNIILN